MESRLDAGAVFKHSLRQLTGNLGSAVRIAGVIVLIQGALQLQIGSMQANFMAEVGGPAEPNAGGFLLLTFLYLIVALIGSLWVAVAWHRFVLLAEYPKGALPAWYGAGIWGYFKTTLKIVLVIMVVLVFIFVLLFLFTGPDILMRFESPDMLTNAVFTLVLILPMAYLAYRISLGLPGAALGNPIRLRDSFRMTRPNAAALFKLAVMTTAMAVAVQILSQMVVGLGIFGAVISIALTFFITLFGISVLTTLYGVLVEKRALA